MRDVQPMELTALTPAQIAPLEALIASYPEVWQDFARSHYLTLLGRRAGTATPEELVEVAELAAELARGVARDLGGSQPYIPVGTLFAAGEKALLMVQAWRAGRPWSDVAAVGGVHERRARQVIQAWQQETYARSQGKLDLV